MKEKETYMIRFDKNYNERVAEGCKNFKKNIAFDKKRYIKNKGLNDEKFFK